MSLAAVFGPRDRSPRRLALALAGAALFFAADARAQTAPEVTSTRDPEALVREGIQLRKDERDADALARFEQAYAIAPSAHIEAQVGLAERALHKWVPAETHLREALADASDPWVEKNRASIVLGLSTVETHLGFLVVESNAGGAELWINGLRAADLPLRAPVRVAEGTNVVDVRAPGFTAVTRIFTVAPSDHVHVFMALEKVPSAEPSVVARAETSPPTASSGSTARTVGFVACAAGLAGLATGIVIGAVALSRPTSLAADGVGSTHDSGPNYAAISLVALISSGVVLATGAVLVLATGHRSRSTALDVAPMLGPGLGGMQLFTTF